MGILTVIISVILTRLPKVGDTFRMLNILVHEFGHALGTKITFGKVSRIDLNRDVSGVAHSTVWNRFSAMVSTFMGYPFASMLSVLLVYLIGIEKYDIVFGILVGIVGISLVFWIRSSYGAIWTVLYLGVMVVVKFYMSEEIYQTYLKLNVGVLYFEAVYIAALLLVMYFRGDDVGDAASMKSHTGIPKGFWVFTFAGISVTAFIWGITFWV